MKIILKNKLVFEHFNKERLRFLVKMVKSKNNIFNIINQIKKVSNVPFLCRTIFKTEQSNSTFCWTFVVVCKNNKKSILSKLKCVLTILIFATSFSFFIFCNRSFVYFEAKMSETFKVNICLCVTDLISFFKFSNRESIR